MMATDLDPELLIDPRAREPAMMARLRDLVDKELIHRAWGCELWKLERCGLITREQREAGDEYERVVRADRRGLEFDIDQFPEELHSNLTRTISAKRRQRKEASELLAFGRDGIFIRRSVDGLCIENEYPATEQAKIWVRTGLSRLETLFFTGSKKPRLRVI
jgi:hypothetical protein